MEVQILLRDSSSSNEHLVFVDLGPDTSIYDIKKKIKEQMNFPIDQ